MTKAASAPDTQEVQTIDVMIDQLAANGQRALDDYLALSQDQVDTIVHAMTLAALEHHMELAHMAVEETGRGVYEDKIIKNLFASEYIYHSIRDLKSVGVVRESELEGFIEIAEPVGVIAGVTPVTNPTSTTIFKSLIAAKTRNPIVFAFHPSAQKCSAAAAKVLLDAAVAAGAPKHCIQWIETPSIDATSKLMNHPGIALILATGGSGMVRSAYSAGKPALGVGPGNVPCYIEKTADVARACTDLMLSKTFDNGMICASEQAVIVDREIAPAFEAFMAGNRCHFLSPEETALVSKYVIHPEKHTLNAAVVGQSAYFIAKQAGVNVPENTKILIAQLEGVGREWPLSAEKLSPVLAYYISDSTEQGFSLARQMLENGGLGHSAVIHTGDPDISRRYGEHMRVGRIVVNQPSSQGAIGDIYNTNTPSLTLGCGSYGRNSTTANVSAVNLLNIKRIAQRKVNMQWFKIPPKIYFERGSVQYLSQMPDIHRAFIVTTPSMIRLGYVDTALHYLRQRDPYCHSEVFSQVEPDPSVETLRRGVEAMNAFRPDVIIALGGGSAMDAAKGMWLFYEHPDTPFEGLHLKFLDIRKRAYQYPTLGRRAKFVAIPTTSGSGSEVTSFSVITDKQGGNTKYPLADYELTPDVAIIDSQFTDSLPSALLADTGIDVLTHALEAYVSVMASDFTDGLAIRAIELVFENLADSFETGSRTAREHMHNASCIAGLAFTNAFLGLCHSMAHKLGGEFGISHGRANAILLPHIIAYNAQKPDKFPIFPKYGQFVADRRYARIARILGLPSATDEQGVASLIGAVRSLTARLGIPATIRECGIDEKAFLDVLPTLSDRAFGDQCTTANPRYPLVRDIEQIYRTAYYGK